jgi:hypothetical protein
MHQGVTGANAVTGFDFDLGYEAGEVVGSDSNLSRIRKTRFSSFRRDVSGDAEV